MSAVHYNN